MLYGGSAGGRQNRRAQHSRPAAGGARHGTRTPGCARVRTAGGPGRWTKHRPGGGGGGGGPTAAGGAGSAAGPEAPPRPGGRAGAWGVPAGGWTSGPRG